MVLIFFTATQKYLNFISFTKQKVFEKKLDIEIKYI